MFDDTDKITAFEKVIDLISAKEVVKAYNSINIDNIKGITKNEAKSNRCKDCIIYKYHMHDTYDSACFECPAHEDDNCIAAVTEFLNSEIPVIPRWQTLNYNNDLYNMALQYYKNMTGETIIDFWEAGQNESLANILDDFVKYLCEEVPKIKFKN